MTDEPVAPVAEPTIPVSALKAAMDESRHDVVGQCWQLWAKLDELVKAAV